MKKQNDKESARDMTNFKPSNFDRDFKAGKGWGSLGAKVRTRTPPLQIDTSHASAAAAVKITRHF